MGRVKNATFAGGSVSDIDVGAPTFRRLIKNVAGDGALNADKLRGINGETGVIVHDGVDGALLGMPIVNQFVGRSINLESHDTGGKNGGVGVTWFWATPVLLSEVDLHVEVGLTFFAEGLPLFAEIRDTSNLLFGLSVPLAKLEGSTVEGVDLWRARLPLLTPGWKLLVLGIDTTDVDDISANGAVGKLHYVRARPRLTLGTREEERGGAESPTFNPDLGFGVTTPAAAEGFSHTDLDALLFADLESIDGYILSRLNRNINGRLEYITGFPAGGSPTYVHEDQDGAGAADSTNPARSRFEAHTKSLYPGGGGQVGEGEIDLPQWCEGFGAFIPAGFFVVDLNEPPTLGMLDHYAPWPIDAVGGVEIAIRTAHMPFPDFQSTTSRLEAMVLFGSTNGAGADPTQYTVKAATTTGSSTAVPADTDGNQVLWLAHITAIPFTGDADELVKITLTRASAKPAGANGRGELCVIGAALAFVKP